MYTNNNLLMYILTTVRWDTTGYYWLMSLANYNFAIYYKVGKTNVDADALSRIPWEEHNKHIEVDLAHAIISNATQSTALTKAYSCNIQVTAFWDTQKDSKPCC